VTGSIDSKIYVLQLCAVVNQGWRLENHPVKSICTSIVKQLETFKHCSADEMLPVTITCCYSFFS